jgi:hypothetical protein
LRIVLDIMRGNIARIGPQERGSLLLIGIKTAIDYPAWAGQVGQWERQNADR